MPTPPDSEEGDDWGGDTYSDMLLAALPADEVKSHILRLKALHTGGKE